MSEKGGRVANTPYNLLDYHACAILCPARMPQVCMINLYRELHRPGSTPVRAPVWYSRWQHWQGQQHGRRIPAAGQLELPFDPE